MPMQLNNWSTACLSLRSNRADRPFSLISRMKLDRWSCESTPITRHLKVHQLALTEGLRNRGIQGGVSALRHSRNRRRLTEANRLVLTHAASFEKIKNI